MGTAAIFFALAAIGGATMAAMRLGGKPLPPTALAVLHGILAAVGLVTLVIAVKGGAVPKLALASLAGFALAAMGGFALFIGFHLKRKELPVPFVLIHGGIAATSFIALLIAMFTV